LANAWNGIEHMMVAKIAYDRLNPSAKAKVDWAAAQLTFNGNKFNAINLATWADQIKHSQGDPYSGHFNNWHFIDLGLNAGDPDLITNPPTLTIRNGDIVSALTLCEKVIKGTPDPKNLVPNAAVAIALMWHLMGDLHQPLHCTTDYYSSPIGKQKTDIGGNAVAVTNLQDAYPNFHALWDGSLEGSWNAAGTEFVIPREVSPFKINDASPKLVAMVSEVTAANPVDPSMSQGDYASWAQETHELGVKAYAALDQDYQSNKVTVREDYVLETQVISRKQVLLAGVRLAAVLNRLYP
jgi:hypothetical protein